MAARIRYFIDYTAYIKATKDYNHGNITFDINKPIMAAKSIDKVKAHILSQVNKTQAPHKFDLVIIHNIQRLT